MNPDYLSDIDFIAACENASITQEQFEHNVQRFVDSGVWRSLQGAWQQQVQLWIDDGIVSL